jgi:serine protease
MILRIGLLVVLAVLSACGGSGSGGGSNVDAAPSTNVVASFTLGRVSGSPGTIIFDASESRVDGASNGVPGIVSYQWDFGDGNTATGVLVSHRYAFFGPYSATLTVTDSAGDTDSSRARTTFNISGSVFAATNSVVDIDVNDPSRQDKAALGPAFQTNNDFAESQELPNPVLLSGFVSNSFASSISDTGNFTNSVDSEDYYSAYLIADQFVSLRVADYDPLNPFLNDIDLELYDSDLNLLAFSDSVTEYESVGITTEGQYYIRVQAFAGISKYALNIGNSSFVTGNLAHGSPADIYPGEAIVKTRPVAVAAAAGSDATDGTFNGAPKADELKGLSHVSHSRAVLAKFDIPSLTVQAASSGTLSSTKLIMAEKNHAVRETLRHIKSMRRRADMEYAVPNYRIKPLLTPNDSFYSLQWHYAGINLPQAWDITTGTPAAGSVIVAVVDTGVVLDHEDLTGQLVPGYDFIRDLNTSKDGDGIDDNPDDPGDGAGDTLSSWHGTHVAGTVAARSNNGLGIAGVSWGGKIMPVRVLGQNGGSSYDVIQGIRYAAGLSNDSGSVPATAADIINLSLGGGGFSQPTQDLFDQLRDLGIIVVAAAGNDGSSAPGYPASYDNVISVSAVDINSELAPYSSFGSFVDIAAPGGDASVDRNGDGYGDGVLSTVFDESIGRDGYSFYQGTSMASPHVAGVAALMKAIYPNINADDFDASLQNGSLTNDLGAAGRDNLFGYGLIDAAKSVRQAQVLAGGTAIGSMLASPSQINFGRSLTTSTLTLSPFGSSPPTVDAIVNNIPWLSIDNSATGGDGSGTYVLSADRTGLADAVYTDVLTFELSNGVNLTIPVLLQVQTGTSFEADVGFLYILLLDADSNDGVAQIAVDVSDGQYQFEFRNIPFGEYVIYAGSDIDDDRFICDVAESCGNYPTNDQALRLTLDSDLQDIDFLASIVADIIGSAATGNDRDRSTFVRQATNPAE